jgi:hypothetical protein
VESYKKNGKKGKKMKIKKAPIKRKKQHGIKTIEKVCQPPG